MNYGNYGDDNEWDDEGSHRQYGSGSHRGDSFSSGHGNDKDPLKIKFDKTIDFKTMVDDDGRLFGLVKLDQATNQQVQNFLPIALTMATDKFGTMAIEKLGARNGQLVGAAIALSPQIANGIRHMFDASVQLRDLHTAVRPLSKVPTSSVAALSGDNEVIANARGKISGTFWQRMLGVVTSAIGSVPALQVNARNAAKAIKEHELSHGMMNAKNNKERAQFLAANIEGGEHPAFKGLKASDIRETLDELVEIKRTDYMKKFKEFELGNKDKIQKEIKEILGAMQNASESDARGYFNKLRRLGVNTDHAIHELDSIKNHHYYDSREYGHSDMRGTVKTSAQQREEAIKKVVEDFRTRKDSRGRKTVEGANAYIEEAVKSKFVQSHGAFDEEWVEFIPSDERAQLNSSGKPKTEKERLKKYLDETAENKRKADSEKEKKAHEGGGLINGQSMVDYGWSLGAGIVSSVVTGIVGGKALEQYAKPIALDRILHLRKTLENAKESPEKVPGIVIGKKEHEDDAGYAKCIATIFSQHQKDCNRADIGDRYVDHLEKARWDDKAIQEMPDEILNPYEYAIKKISKRIKDGRMDTIALVELVGDKHKRIVRADGRSFGPMGAGNDEKAQKEAIKKLIDEKTATLSGGQTQTEEQVNDKLGEFIFSVDDLKKALESNELEKEQRAFIFTLFSNIVGTDEKLCAKIGIAQARCMELRKECKETFDAKLDGAVLALAEMIEKDPETLEKSLKLTDEEKQLVRSVSEKIQDEHHTVGDAVEDGKDLKKLETVVANAAMTLRKEPGKPGDDGKPQNFWQKMVTAARKHKEEMAKPKEKPEDQEDKHEFSSHKKKKSKPKRHEDEHEELGGFEEHEESHGKKRWADDDHVRLKSRGLRDDFEGGYAAREHAGKGSGAFDAGMAV